MPANNPPEPRRRVVTAPSPGLCLDFANTRFWRGAAVPTESLTDYGALLRWLAQAGVVDADAEASLRVLGDSDAAAAQPLLRDSLQARELIYRLFSALATAERAESGAADGADADGLADLVARAPVRSDLVFAPGAAGWRVAMITPSVGEVLAPVLWSAADLALAAQRVRLRQCANPRCRWLFLDDSKGGTRRWCSMSACGNRAKAHRHFLRQAEARLKDAPSG